MFRRLVFAAAIATFTLDSSCSTSSPCSPTCDGSASDGGNDAAQTVDVAQPPLHAACATPAITDAGSITLEGGPPTVISGTWNGTEAALAYYEGPNVGPFAVKLQRMTQDGQLLANVTMGSVAGYTLQTSVASDGNVYVVCWMGGTSSIGVQCASLSIATGVVTPGFSVPPNALGGAVAYGAGGFVVSYSASPPSLWVQALDANAAAKGAPVQVAPNGSQYAHLAPTTDGYALADQTASTVYQLDAQLHVVGTATFPSTSTYSGFAASGSVLAADWSDGDSGTVRGATTGSSTFVIGAGSDAGCGLMTAAPGLGSFAFTWDTSDETIAYRAYDTSGTALGASVSLPPSISIGSCTQHALTAVGDGYLIANPQLPNNIWLYHLGCP